MLKSDNAVLMIIDVQGKLAQLMHDRDALFKSLQVMIQSFKILEIPMIWMEQIPENLGPTISEVAQLLPDMKPIPKFTFSCCGNEQFMEKFKAIDRKQVLICGIESHICVYQTAVDLLNMGCEVQVLCDCVSSRTPENRQLGIDRMKDAGAVLTGTEMALFEMLKQAKGPLFKQIVKIIK
ncbi:MAG: hydrolase [Desulfobacteraceae bacterium]|nr:hydrolase [Desulfobacteraceae bacterium]